MNNARLLPKILSRRHDSSEAEGVLRYVRESRFDDIQIQVRGGQVFVNGQAVDPADAAEARP